MDWRGDGVVTTQSGEPKEDSIDKILKDLIVASNGGYWYSYSGKVEIKELGEAVEQIEAHTQRQVREELEKLRAAFYDEHPTFNGDELTKRIDELKGEQDV